MISKIENIEKKELRKFGLIWAAILSLITVLPLISNKPIRVWALILSLLFSTIAIILPEVLKQIYIGWVLFGRALGWLNTRIILILVFFIVITPTSVIMKLLRKDILCKKIQKESNSYWCKREIQPTSMKKQF